MSAMTWLLTPAVRLMNRLRYPQKFVLISLVFAIPIGLMMGLWLVELHGRIAFAASERRGLEYIRALRNVLEPLDRSRALRPLAEAGDPSAREGLAKDRVRITAAATVVDSLNDRLGQPQDGLALAGLPVGEDVACEGEHRGPLGQALRAVDSFFLAGP